MTSGLQSMASHLGWGVTVFEEDIATNKVSEPEGQRLFLGVRGKDQGGGGGTRV